MLKSTHIATELSQIGNGLVIDVQVNLCVQCLLGLLIRNWYSLLRQQPSFPCDICSASVGICNDALFTRMAVEILLLFLFRLTISVIVNCLRMLRHDIVDILIVITLKLGLNLIIAITGVLNSISHLTQVVNNFASYRCFVRDVILERLHSISIDFLFVIRYVSNWNILLASITLLEGSRHHVEVLGLLWYELITWCLLNGPQWPHNCRFLNIAWNWMSSKIFIGLIHHLLVTLVVDLTWAAHESLLLLLL